MKIGIIGIGDICKKAYLPILTALNDIEIVLCTRNNKVLDDMKNKYKITECCSSVTELISSNIHAAFVHSSTESHFEICKELLENNINVYVDKPISYNLKDALELKSLALKHNKVLMVGFNRRHAPMINGLPELGTPQLILIQKNRFNLPGDDRIFIYDDFIHVVDTLRFLLGNNYEDFTVNYLKDENGLKNVVLKLSNPTTTAIGIMNRDNGITEEVIEYMTSKKKEVITSLTTGIHYENNLTSLKNFNDWENTLTKRGFSSIIHEFIEASRKNVALPQLMEDWTKTHELCEKILSKIM